LDNDRSSSRKKYDAAVSEALRKGDAPFLCNVLGYEETIIEFCVRQKTTIVKKLLSTRPDLQVDADQFIPQPGVLLNDATTRSLGKTEYIKAFTTYSSVLFDLQVADAVTKGDESAVQALPLLRLTEAAKEACRQGKDELVVSILERLYRGVPTASDNPLLFGKREPIEVVERYNKAHQLAMQRAKTKPKPTPKSAGSAYNVDDNTSTPSSSMCCALQ
jgi:hypothetical protein